MRNEKTENQSRATNGERQVFLSTLTDFEFLNKCGQTLKRACAPLSSACVWNTSGENNTRRHLPPQEEHWRYHAAPPMTPYSGSEKSKGDTRRQLQSFQPPRISKLQKEGEYPKATPVPQRYNATAERRVRETTRRQLHTPSRTDAPAVWRAREIPKGNSSHSPHHATRRPESKGEHRILPPIANRIELLPSWKDLVGEQAFSTILQLESL